MSSEELTALVSAVQRHSTRDQSVNTAIPELHLSCFSAPTELTALVYEPCLCIIAQGATPSISETDAFAGSATPDAQ